MEFDKGYLILLLISFICSSVGWYVFIYFISIGYAFSILVQGVAILVMFRSSLDLGTIILSGLLVAYGARLGSFLLKRFVNQAYKKNIGDYIDDGSKFPFILKVTIWATVSVEYVTMTSTVYFRLLNGDKSDLCAYIGAAITLGGLLFEAEADREKFNAKQINPKRFVDTGLYRIVRCPNYLGEIIIWLGIFISGFTTCKGAFQWINAVIGWASITYIMFGGARRLELRQNKNYNDNPEYKKYVKSTPILLPLVPLYSVADYTWLKG